MVICSALRDEERRKLRGVLMLEDLIQLLLWTII